jgi:hypothetical protein
LLPSKVGSADAAALGALEDFIEGAGEVETVGTSLSIILGGALVVEGHDEEIRAGK